MHEKSLLLVCLKQYVLSYSNIVYGGAQLAGCGTRRAFFSLKNCLVGTWLAGSSIGQAVDQAVMRARKMGIKVSFSPTHINTSFFP
jgi:hypothetical protein